MRSFTTELVIKVIEIKIGIRRKWKRKTWYQKEKN